MTDPASETQRGTQCDPQSNPQSDPPPLPLAGVRVIEFTHMVMGPSCGMLLADLGADVVKVEPLAGDKTRHLLGAGSGFFPTFNRNKRSLAIDVKDARGRDLVLDLIDRADVFIENFKAGTMARLGFGYPALSQRNPRLIYVSHKGFLPGPYDERTALDEVVQMMGGLAYMTGPVGQPLRAGASVNDIMGGMFGTIGVLSALRVRESTGRGCEVQSALFENNVLLVAQHMMQFAVTGQAPSPMPERISAWGVYDVFTVRDGEQIFLAAVSDTQWTVLCREFGFDDLGSDVRLVSNNDRVRQRDWLLPELRRRFEPMAASELAERFHRVGLPYAPIKRPEELFDDPHLRATGGLAPVTIPADATGVGRTIETRTALLPLTFDGDRLPVRRDPPGLGDDTATLLRELGLDDRRIAALAGDGVIGLPPGAESVRA